MACVKATLLTANEQGRIYENDTMEKAKALAHGEYSVWGGGTYPVRAGGRDPKSGRSALILGYEILAETVPERD